MMNQEYSESIDENMSEILEKLDLIAKFFFKIGIIKTLSNMI